MKISVIIPIYNSELYLDDLFLSLANQKLQDFEIIAIDDVSKDHSLSILEKWQKQFLNKMKIVHNSINLGAGASRNIGLKMAQGEYVSFIDSDDFIHPNMLYDMYYGALKNNKPEVLSTGIILVNASQNYSPYFGSLRRDGILFSPQINSSKVLSLSPSCGNKLFKRDFIAQEFLPNVMWEDIPFSYSHLFLANQVLDFHNPDYYYRKHINSGISAQGLTVNLHLLDIFQVMDYFGTFLQEKGIYEKLQKDIITVQVIYSLYRIREVLDWNIPTFLKKQLVADLYHIIKLKYTDIKKIDQDSLNMKVDFYTIDQVLQAQNSTLSLDETQTRIKNTLQLLKNGH